MLYNKEMLLNSMLCSTGLRKTCFYLPILLWDYSLLIKNLDETEKNKQTKSTNNIKTQLCCF